MMAMDIAEKLEKIQKEVEMVVTEKCWKEENLGLFWEHLPAIDPTIIRDRMMSLHQQIVELENRRKQLLQQEKDLIVDAVILYHLCGAETEKKTATEGETKTEKCRDSL